MFSSIADDIKRQFQWGNMLTRIIIVNVAVYIAFVIIKLGFTIATGNTGGGYSTFLSYFQLNGDLLFTAKHPWVFITHMFLHGPTATSMGLWHLAWNMILLYWFGRIVGDLIDRDDRRILPIYLLGGLVGALAFLISAPFVYPGGATAHGASAAVMAMLAVAAMVGPDYNLHLILIGPVKLKFVALALVVIDMASISNMDNTGGHIAHLGGFAFGMLYVKMLERGDDMADPVNRFFDWFQGLFKEEPKKFTRQSSREKDKTKRKVFVRYKAEQGKQAPSDQIDNDDFQSKLDRILEKISDSGYDSLSEEEKTFLAEASKK